MLKVIGSTIAGLALAACTPVPPPAFLSAPADPAIKVRDVRVTSATAGIEAYKVVEPKDWRELNRAVGPQR